MEISFYIRLDTPPKGANHAKNFDGKAAAKNWEKLTAAAKEMGIKPLQEFVSIRKEDLAPVLGEKQADSAVTVRKEGWYSAQEGLKTIRKLISRVSDNKTTFDKARMLIRDLQSFENILSAAESRGSRFHFSPEFEGEKKA